MLRQPTTVHVPFFINLNKEKIMAQVNAKRLNDAVEILDDYCEVFDNKEYDLLSEKEKTLLYEATVLLEKVVIRMQNHGDYSLIKK